MPHTTKNSPTHNLQKVETSRTFRLTKSIARWMDRYYLDPIIGFFLPAYGDVVTALLNLPYLDISMLKLRSIPLTLAIIYNLLFDVCVGLIPLLGDLFDVFNKSYTKNSRLLTGFVEGNRTIIREVNRKALIIGVLCLLLILFIYLLIYLTIQFAGWVGTAISTLFA